MIEDKDMESALEAVLFVSTDAITEKQLSVIFDCEESDITGALQGLQKKYESSESGICLKQIAGG